MSDEQGVVQTRRAVLAGAGAVGVAAALAACSPSSSSTGDSGSSTSGDSRPSSGSSTGSSGGGNTGAVLAKTTDIEVGGGKIIADQQVVVTQPTKGTFKCFTAVCTHQGAALTKVADGQITCPLHNSKFSAEDGSVKSGPATKPLAEKEIKVSGEDITLA